MALRPTNASEMRHWGEYPAYPGWRQQGPTAIPNPAFGVQAAADVFRAGFRATYGRTRPIEGVRRPHPQNEGRACEGRRAHTGGHHGTRTEGDARDRDGGRAGRDRERLRTVAVLPGRGGIDADPRGRRRLARAVLLAGPPLGSVRRVPLHHGEGAPRLGRPVGRGDRARAHPPARGGGQGRLAPREPGGPRRFGVRRRGRVRGPRGDRAVQDRYDIVGFDPRGVGRSTAVVPRAGGARQPRSSGSRRARAGATRGSPGRTSSRTPSGRRAWRTPARCSPTSTP